MNPSLTINHKDCLSTLRYLAGCIGAMFVMAAFANCSGCMPAQAPTFAEQNYTNDIIACAATAGYPGAYDHAADMRCRADVDCKYGVGPCAR